MSEFCLSWSENSLNTVLQTACINSNIKEKLRGTTDIDLFGDKQTIIWEIRGTPQVNFKDFDDNCRAINEKGDDLVLKQDERNLFFIEADTGILLKNDDQSNAQENIIHLNVVSNAFLNNSAISIKIVGIRIDNLTSLDHSIIKGIGADLIKRINTVMGFKDDGSVPHLFTLKTLENIGIRSNNTVIEKVHGNFQIWGTNGNTKPFDTSATKDFSLALSNDTLKEVLNKQFSEQLRINPKISKDFEDSVDWGISTAKAKAHIDIVPRQVSCTSVDDGKINMTLSTDLGFDGDVYTTTIFGDAHLGKFGYDYSFTPNPLITSAKIDMSQNVIHYELSNFQQFAVLLTPRGDFIQKIMSGLLWPLAEIITNFITVIIPDTIKIPGDIQFKTVQIPLMDAGILELDLNDLNSSFGPNCMYVSGNVKAHW